MPTVYLKPLIKAPAARCFDLSRSVEAHLASTVKTGERIIGGRTQGLLELGDTVTWEARHLYIRQSFTSKITRFEPPRLFVDEMVLGAFHRFHHTHEFHDGSEGTLMLDVVDFSSPLGWVGMVADHVFLKRYLTGLLVERNRYLKEAAETEMATPKGSGEGTVVDEQ